MRKNIKTCIYTIKSKIKPDRIYIGSAVDFVARKSVHMANLKKNNHNRKLQNHCNKYGIEDIVFEIIELCSKEMLIEREQYYLDILKPYFNVRKIAERNFGVECREETRKKIALIHKGNKYNLGKKASDETKALLSLASKGHKHNLGRIFTEEHKNKISKANKGNKHTEETKIKITNSKIGKGVGLNNLQYIMDNIPNKSQSQIARELGISQSTISKILKRCI